MTVVPTPTAGLWAPRGRVGTMNPETGFAGEALFPENADGPSSGTARDQH